MGTAPLPEEEENAAGWIASLREVPRQDITNTHPLPRITPFPRELPELTPRQRAVINRVNQRSRPGPRHRQAHPGRTTFLHRLRTVILTAAFTAALYIIQQMLWPHAPFPHSAAAWAWSWSGAIWALAFIPAAFELAGMLAWRAPRAPAQEIPQLVCWRIVSRGLNRDALLETITACRTEMKRTPLFDYVIEVLTDSATPEGMPAPADDLRYIRVPGEYATSGGTIFKARALNYCLENSPLPDDAWIVHLDEETCPTASGITGIAAAIREEEASGRMRIGQGTITYHRDWAHHPFMTLSDCVRTGSDFGRLYISMMIGVPLFGLHGSFIVIRNDVEKKLGFDVGPVGSLTEDAWWGTIAMDQGYRCRWVEGHLAEQCTHRVRDFLKQRRRWFNGMGRTALHAPVRWRWRFILGISMLAWASAPFAWVYTVGHIIDGGYIDPVIRALANASLAIYIATTLTGLGMNMHEHGIRHPLRKLRWSLTWLACMPVFSLLESAAVAFAIFRPAKNFHVVNK